jgi:hypothetical protein
MNYFKVIKSKLYIDGSVLDFNMPSGNYSVQIDLIDLEDDSIIVSRNHTVYVEPCECDQPTTTTSTTTSTTTEEPTTTTTTTTEEPTTTTTTTTEAPCCDSLTIQFRTYTIPDSLTMYDSDDNPIMSTGPISTGGDFITLVLNNLPCGFYFCVDAPLGGTAWDLITTGCVEINTSGGQNIEPNNPYCYDINGSTSNTTTTTGSP